MDWFASVEPGLPKAWERVWSSGRDVTCEPVASSPPYPRRYFRQGWRPKLYPGELVDWPDPETIKAPGIGRSRAGRGSRHG
jgi:hypothetical protein